MMKTCSRDLLQQMTETYKTRIAGTDDFRSTLDALFFTALRAARESDTLRQFDCFKEAEKSSDAPARREKDGQRSA